MKSIKLVQDKEKKNIYWMTLTYNSKESCKISVYYWVNQTINHEGVPMYFAIPPDLPKNSVTTVEKGIGKSFEGFEEAWFDVEKYENIPLFNSTMTYYPCVITIEPDKEPTQLPDGFTDYQNLITYCTFMLDKKTNALQIKPIKQMLIIFEVAFVLQQIYGITDALEESKGEELGMIPGVDYDWGEAVNQWVIWIWDVKNTIVMPCGHLWVCRDCAVTISQQKSPDWPVWRKKVTSFVPINITSIRNMDSMVSTKGKKVEEDTVESNKRPSRPISKPGGDDSEEFNSESD